MKKLLITFTLFSVAVLTYGQQGNATTSTTTESYGLNAGTEGVENAFFGAYSGAANSTGKYNTFIGYQAGHINSSGLNNTFLGHRSGRKNTSGNNNTFLGVDTGEENTSGYSNVFVGNSTGRNNTSGRENTFIGISSGMNNVGGRRNVYIGKEAGKNNNGTGNIFIGNQAGALVGFSTFSLNNKLYIDNTNTMNPLIYGDFANDQLTFNGTVGIGTTDYSQQDAGAKLIVNGKILCEEVEVIQDVLPDYVFQKYYNGVSNLKSDYVMPTLEEVEAFTRANHHLPEVPSAAEVKENGMPLKDITTILLQKVEELTLYTIEQEKRIKALEAELKK